VSSKKIEKNFMEDADGQVPLPSADEAWKLMRQKLDKEMPVGGGPFARPLLKWGAISLVVVTIAFLWSIASRLNENHKQIENTTIAGTKSHDSIEGNKRTQSGEKQETFSGPDAKRSEGLTETFQEDREVMSASEIGDKTYDNVKTKRKRGQGNFDQSSPGIRNSFRNTKKGRSAKSGNKPPHQTGADKQAISNTGKNSADFIQQNTEQKVSDSTTIDKLIDNIDGDIKQSRDSVAAIENNQIDIKPDELEISFGLQWNLQVPNASPAYYFSGPDAGSQPYRVLLPGAWINLRADRSLFSAEINPFFSQLVPAKSYGTFTSSENINDTIVIVTEQRTLHKLFGVSAGLGFSRQTWGKWWMGGGLQGSWWSKGVASTEGLEEKTAIGTVNKITRTYDNDHALPESDWSYFSKSQLSISAHIFHRSPKWHGGLRFSLPITPLAKSHGPKNPLRMEFVFGVRAYTNKK
jgi:hypothetical protein